MGINYRCEPMRERLKDDKYKSDPAYVFSSVMHGDPATPILETYPGDEIVIRLADGAHEEQHAFNLTGMSWKREITDPASPDVASQTLGISEAFNIHITKQYGPGESKKYLWYADKEYGACILQSFGDMRNHRYHGLFGAIIIEPPGAKWYQSCSLAKALYDEEAVITAPGTCAFRECVVMIQNGIRMIDKDGNLVKTTAQEEGEEPDAEDTGEKGYNYRSERFANRLKRNSRISKVISSRVHGDPATPVFKAYTGERVIFRTMMPADKPRNVGFLIHANQWKEQPHDPYSRVVPMQGAVSIGNTYNMELKDGACCPGDYLYRSGSLKWDVESGMWGIFRVMKQGIGCKCRSVCRKLMNCVGK